MFFRSVDVTRFQPFINISERVDENVPVDIARLAGVAVRAGVAGTAGVAPGELPRKNATASARLSLNIPFLKCHSLD